MNDNDRGAGQLVTAVQLAGILGVSARTIRRLRAAGVIAPIMVTPVCPRYDVGEVLQHLKEQGRSSDEK